MIFNPKQFLDDFGIPNTLHGKHTKGWISINCPHCKGQSNWTGGFNLSKEWYNCFRCGWSSIPNTIMALLQCDYRKAISFIQQYRKTSKPDKEFQFIQTAEIISFPPDCHPLDDRHRRYLESRGLDPDELIQDWNLQGTGPIGDYKFRIIAPIYLNEQMVSYQGRDITDKQFAKYMACEKKDEVVHHKHTLYGIDKAKGDSAIIVEGVTDVWRLGRGSVATFGIEFTSSQIRMLADKFKKIFVFFDSEEQAQVQADKLMHQLNGLNRDVEIVETDQGDPADLSIGEARLLKKDLL